MSRIGTFAAHQMTLAKNLEAQARAQDARIQLASGKKSQTYDGVASDVRRLESLEGTHAANRAFTRAIERTDLRLQEMETAVGQMQDIAAQFRTSLLQAASAENLSSTNIQSQAGQFLDEVGRLLNSRLDGRFLFAGTATDRPPIDFTDNNGARLPFNDASTGDIESGAYYQGNDDTLTVRADRGVTVSYGVSADPTQDTGFHDLIKALSRVADPRESLAGEVENAIRDLAGGVLSHISQSTAVSDPAAPLAGVVATAGSLQLADSGGASASIAYDPSVDSLEDVAARINDTAAADARVAFVDGTARLEVFSESGQDLQLTETGGGSLIADLGVIQANSNQPGAIQRLADTRADLGSSLDILGRISSRLADARVDIEEGISGIEDVDVTRAMTELSAQQTTLETSFAVTARLNETTLLNFLR